MNTDLGKTIPSSPDLSFKMKTTTLQRRARFIKNKQATANELKTAGKTEVIPDSRNF